MRRICTECNNSFDDAHTGHKGWHCPDCKQRKARTKNAKHTARRRTQAPRTNHTTLRNKINRNGGAVCTICTHWYPETHLHVHHITRLADGGTDNPSNLTILCKPCHNRTHNAN